MERVEGLAGRRLVITTDAVGGVWRYALDVAAGFAAGGVRATLLGSGPEPVEAQRREADAVGVELSWLDERLDWTLADAREAKALAGHVADRVAALGADVLHLNAPALAGVGSFPAPTLVAAHSCLATWWRAVRGTALPGEWAWHADLTGRGLRRAAVAVAPSAAYAADLEAAYGSIRRLRVVQNGARPVRRRREDQAVLAAGRLWDEGKNFGTLDAAAARIDWPVLAAGPDRGPAGNRIETRHLRRLGQLDAEAMAERLGRAAIFASISLYEPFGLAVLEAATAGAALILSDIPTFRELWGETAIFVDPRDSEDVAQAVNALIADPGRRRRLGAEAAGRAAHYTLEAQREALAVAYRDALALDRAAA